MDCPFQESIVLIGLGINYCPIHSGMAERVSCLDLYPFSDSFFELILYEATTLASHNLLLAHIAIGEISTQGASRFRRLSGIAQKS